MERLPKIVRERLRSSAVDDHPGADLLAAFLEQSLPERERERVMEHLSRCAGCREIVSLAAPATGAGAAVVAPTSAAGDQDRVRSGWWGRRQALRWGVAAAFAAVLAAAVLVRGLRHAPRTAGPGAPAALPTAARSPAAQSAPGRNATVDGNASGLVANGNLSEATPRGPGSRLANGGRKQPAARGSRANDLAMANEPKAGAAGAGIGAVGKLSKKSPSVSRFGADVGLSGANRASNTAAQTALREEAIAPAEKQAMNRAKPAAALEGFQAPQALQQRRAQAPETNSSGLTAGSARFDTSGNPPIAKLKEASPAPAAKLPPAAAGSSEKTVTGAGAGEGPAENALRWTLSAEGALEKSADSGQTWATVDVANGTKFRAISALGSEIWAGGAGGTLFHSPDGGAHWVRVRPTAHGTMLTDGIVRIQFIDTRRGFVTTENGEIWATGDGGATWEEH